MNARASTGPRTAAGKARSAQNARRHGLSVPAERDAALVAEIDALAQVLAGNEADALRLALARQVAAAQIDVMRVRNARRRLSARLAAEPGLIAQIARLEPYERDALVRRRRATQEFGAPQPLIDSAGLTTVSGIFRKRTQRTRSQDEQVAGRFRNRI